MHPQTTDPPDLAARTVRAWDDEAARSDGQDSVALSAKERVVTPSRAGGGLPVEGAEQGQSSGDTILTRIKRTASAVSALARWAWWALRGFSD